MSDALERHAAAIDACNQRGGRMLSIVDLVEAGTFGRDLAAYALAAIGGGASFLTAALPGGAGKTTVMGALLNFVPPDVELQAADGLASIRRAGLTPPPPRRCYVCHEIGPGRYYAYLWGEALRAYFELAAAGHMLATNIHADTYDQIVEQVCRTNGVPVDLLRRVHLVFFLELERGAGGAGRRITRVLESDGGAEHRVIYDRGQPGPQVPRSALVAPRDLAGARARIDSLLASGARTIRQVRAGLLRGREEA